MSTEGCRAIDAVVNLFTPEAKAKGWVASQDRFRNKMRMKPEYAGGVPIEDYVAKMDRAGIERSFLIAARQGDRGRKGAAAVPYEAVFEVCRKHPDRFSGIAGIDPLRDADGLRELEQAVTDYGFVGAQIQPHWFELPLDHVRFYPYYAKCGELGLPVMIQVGNAMVYRDDRRVPSAGRPITLDRIAIDFPDLTLIGIHTGWPWTEELIAMAWKHPNVHIGLDAYAPRYWPAALVHYANSFGQDKVLFGTAWPVIDPERAIPEIERHALRPEAKRKLLRGNASRLFKLAERTTEARG